MKVTFNAVGVSLLAEGDAEIKLLAELAGSINAHASDIPFEFAADLGDYVPPGADSDPSRWLINARCSIVGRTDAPLPITLQAVLDVVDETHSRNVSRRIGIVA